MTYLVDQPSVFLPFLRMLPWIEGVVPENLLDLGDCAVCLQLPIIEVRCLRPVIETPKWITIARSLNNCITVALVEMGRLNWFHVINREEFCQNTDGCVVAASIEPVFLVCATATDNFVQFVQELFSAEHERRIKQESCPAE